jgi:hypothetical protein
MFEKYHARDKNWRLAIDLLYQVNSPCMIDSTFMQICSMQGSFSSHPLKQNQLCGKSTKRASFIVLHENSLLSTKREVQRIRKCFN